MFRGRIALVQPPLAVGESYHLAEPVGLLIVGAALRAAGFGDVRLLDLALEFAEGSLPPGADLIETSARRLAHVEADSYGFSVQCVDLPLVLPIARRLKALLPDTRVILGGHQASLLGSELVKRFDFIDEVVQGSGESYVGVPQDHWIEPAYDLAPDFSRYARVSRLPTGLVEVGRGCPYNCSYCSIPAALGRRMRHKPVEHIVREVRLLRERGCTHVHFVHDTLTLNRDFVSSLLTALEAHCGGITWSGMTRADLVDADLLKAMARSGCQGILIGLDSVDDLSLSLIDKRAHRYPSLIDLVTWHDDADIAPTFYFLVDLPGDTRESTERSLRHAALASVIDPGCCRIQGLRVVPGTRMAARRELDLTMDTASPYAQWLVATVGTSGEPWDLIARHPDLFSTYYKAAGPLDHPTASALTWQGTKLFESFPMTLAALAERRGILELFEALGRRAPGRTLARRVESETADFLESHFAEHAPDLVDVVRFEYWLRAGKGTLRSRVTPTAVRDAVLNRRPLTPALFGAQRLYRHRTQEGGDNGNG